MKPMLPDRRGRRLAASRLHRGIYLLIGLGALLLILFFGPLLVPVPALEDTVPPIELADADSRFVDIDGLTVHYKEHGAGEPAMLLLHGFAASTFTWREVMEPLGGHGRVVAYDRPAFGLTERPVENLNPNVYAPAYQPDLAVALMDTLGIDRAILVGNSAGGAVAMRTALAYPERVQALILVDPAVYTGQGMPAIGRLLANTPQGDHLGPLIARQIKNWGHDFGRMAWHNSEGFTDEIWQAYTRPLQAENWDRALWYLTAAGAPADLANQLDDLTLPVLVITGDDDRIVPEEQSIRLAGELPNSELVVIPNCGHVPQEECPEAFMAAVDAFLAKHVNS
jgi:pimeloyl-ACP methyl ester carboxylesterase